MAIGRLPIRRAVVVAYQDALRAAQAMRGLFLLTLLIVLSIHVVNDLLPYDLTASVIRIPVEVVRAVLLTPVLVAVQRFILLGDASDRYAIELSNPRFFRFLFWSLALLAVSFGPGLLLLMLSSVFGLPATIAFVGLSLSLVVYVIVGLRLTVLFPAIAVDAPGATASNSVADTRGFTVDICLIYLLTLLPIGAAEWVLHGLNPSIMLDITFGVIFDVSTLPLSSCW